MEETLEPIELQLNKPGRLKELPLTRTKFAVVPLKALDDPKLSDGAARTLARICGYANRAGLAWVSQTRLARDIGMRREVINRHFQALKEHGYLQQITGGINGVKGATIRVVFDPTISTRTAIARAGNGQDDMIPPEEQKRLIAQMLRGAIKTVNPQADQRRYTMPADGQTAAVKRIKAGMKKPPKPVDKSVDNPVDNSKKVLEKSHTQVLEKSHSNYIKSIGIDIVGIDSKELITVLEVSTDYGLFVRLVDQVIARYAAEGLPPPKLPALTEAVLLAQQQYLENALGMPTGDDRGAE